jgi:hypothetical protein
MSEKKKSARQTNNNINLEYLKSKRRVAELACKINRSENFQHDNEAVISYDRLLRKENNSFPASESHISFGSASIQIISDHNKLNRSPELEEILSLLGINIVPPSLSGQNDTAKILENIMRKIETDVQTAGLRQGREAVILSSIYDLRAEQEKLRSAHLATFEQFSSNAQECIMKAVACISLLCKQLCDCNRMNEHAKQEAHRAKEECAQAKTELDVACFKISSIQEEAERVKSDAYEKCVQSKATILSEFKAKFDDFTQKMQQEEKIIKIRYTHESEKEREQIDMGWQEKYLKLENKCAELQKIASEKLFEVSSLKSIVEQYENERQMDIITREEALHCLRDEIINERASLQREKEKNEQLSTENNILVRRLEKSNLHLMDVEVKVKRALDVKNLEYQSAMMQLRMLENQLKELDQLT